MEINNENEIYTLHFMFSYKYSTYQVMRRQQITQNIIHENL